MHAHDLAEHLVLPLAEHLLRLPAAALLSLPQLPVALSQLDHGRDSPLLLEAQQLLRQLVERLGDDAALDGLEHALEGLVPELVDVPLLFDCGRRLRVALGGAQLIDEVQALLLALEHEILVRPAADDALQQQHSCFLLLFLRQHVLLELRGVRPVEDVPQIPPLRPAGADGRLAALGGVQLRGLRQLLLDPVHRTLQCGGDFQLLALLVAGLGRLQVLGVLVGGPQQRGRQRALELHQAGEGREVSGLHLHLRRVVVGHMAVAGEGGVDLRRQVRVLSDDVAFGGGLLCSLPLLLHLSKDLGALPLQGSELAVAFLLLLLPHALHLVALRSLALRVAVQQCCPKEHQAFLLQFLDLLFTVSPVTELLRFHQLHSDIQVELVRRRRQHLLEEALLPRTLDNLQLRLRGWQALVEGQVCEGQHLRHLVGHDVILRRVRIRLGLRLAVGRLRANSLARWLRDCCNTVCQHGTLLRGAPYRILHNVRQRAEHLLVWPAEELVSVLAGHKVVICVDLHLLVGRQPLLTHNVHAKVLLAGDRDGMSRVVREL
mmetsp:Transcript_145066/g.404150  ORF Transcript_145066/g.404150 Transcript_145066/m.404150 type:complete len:547 (+) Transcript_145066:495-2135(+)